jgi:hypothetical protein
LSASSNTPLHSGAASSEEEVDTMKKIILAVATALVATTAAASADTISRRQEYQSDRIEQGRKTGSITWTEGLKLRAEQKRIARTEEAYRDKGYLTRSDRRDLRGMQNEASAHIAQKKNNSWYRAWWAPRVGK